MYQINLCRKNAARRSDGRAVNCGVNAPHGDKKPQYVQQQLARCRRWRQSPVTACAGQWRLGARKASYYSCAFFCHGALTRIAAVLAQKTRRDNRRALNARSARLAGVSDRIGCRRVTSPRGAGCILAAISSRGWRIAFSSLFAAITLHFCISAAARADSAPAHNV